MLRSADKEYRAELIAIEEAKRRRAMVEKMVKMQIDAAKNKKKIINILNENNFSNEDCIMITRSFIIKAKKLLALSKAFEINKSIDLTISSAKPPVFWKEKEITKQQIYKWKSKDIKKLIYKLSEIEYLIKKENKNSLNIVTDFILDQSSNRVNNLA